MEYPIIRPYIKTIATYGLSSCFSQQYRGYIGVSICSHFYSKKRVREIINWAAINFSEFLFLIADEPQLYTFMSTKGLDYEKAYEKAMKIGDEKFTSIKRLVESSSFNNVNVVRWQDIAHSDKFSEVQRKITQCYILDANFKKDVLDQVQLRNDHLTDEDDFSRIDREKFDVAAMYVLNEISVMVYLQETSDETFPIQVYPFKMPPALKGLYENIYCNEIKLTKEKSGYIQIEIEDNE